MTHPTKALHKFMMDDFVRMRLVIFNTYLRQVAYPLKARRPRMPFSQNMTLLRP